MATIFAVSSGRPPAAIAVIRVSGAGAMAAVEALAGTLPPPRRAALRTLLGGDGGLLDRALVLCFPGPNSATGEDLVELHCHGGRAVVAAVEGALAALPGLRQAEPGEFTRRALEHGRIDLAEAEGLADLLEAETEAARVAAVAAVEGRVSREVRGWLDRLAGLAARVEVVLDYADEAEEVADAALAGDIAALADELRAVLATPPVERLRDGVRVVIAGPPNSGKSTLLNLMTEREAAIVSPISGTTRDRIEAPVVRRGQAYLLTDTAGLIDTSDVVEAIGVERAGEAIRAADLLLWLGDMPPPRVDAIWVHARADVAGREGLPVGRALAIAESRPATIAALWALVEERASALLPRVDVVPFKRHQRAACATALGWLAMGTGSDLLLLAERLRHARAALVAILGLDATEAMLDAMFARFCLGK